MSPFDPFALSRWDPWSEMTSLREAMNRLLETSFVRPNLAFSTTTGMDVPIDMSETDNEYRIRAHLPGMKPEDVHISAHSNSVTIEGERHEEQAHKEGGRRLYTEHRYGSFSRSFSLPTPVDADHCSADFKDGVLTLTMPKMEAARPRRIQVGSAAAIEAPRTMSASSKSASRQANRAGGLAPAASSGRVRTGAATRGRAATAGRTGTRATGTGRTTGDKNQPTGGMLPGEGGGPVQREPVAMPEENRTRQRTR